MTHKTQYGFFIVLFFFFAEFCQARQNKPTQTCFTTDTVRVNNYYNPLSRVSDESNVIYSGRDFNDRISTEVVTIKKVKYLLFWEAKKPPRRKYLAGIIVSAKRSTGRWFGKVIRAKAECEEIIALLADLKESNHEKKEVVVYPGRSIPSDTTKL